MKKCVAFISSVLISSAVLLAPAFAGVDVEDAMKEMGKSYRLVMQDTDAASLQKDLATLRAAAAQAQSAVPDRMKKQAADSADRKTFTTGIQELIDQIDVASKLVNEGKVPEAKAEAAKLKDIMEEYHSKLGV